MLKQSLLSKGVRWVSTRFLGFSSWTMLGMSSGISKRFPFLVLRSEMKLFDEFELIHFLLCFCFCVSEKHEKLILLVNGK